ncbi:hypothetical protein [Rummeliibacillus sp. POC4]|uniref:hypothetical protein n=1 Tax=Rummeliibacillus sp. POC4 TaxID=2305899 RepID=UPI000E67513B|nr:hypothetical protein [Rummeliibacillus sp. POC4]RIJ69664.1 hypothetical protein D1606_00395 [Rummeliibacillus sp. POC4]
MNFQWKERLKKVSDVTTNTKYVPEKAKTIGVFFFYLFVLIIMLVLLFFVVGLCQRNHYIAAIIVAIIGCSITFFLWKIISADSIDNEEF